jgi:predicted O-methyltransferase YrrM
MSSKALKITGKIPKSIRSIAKKLIRSLYSYGIPYVHTRKELPHILNQRGLLGKGAEIGVLKGEYSCLLLEKWEGEQLYCVDPWREFGEDEYEDVSNVSQDRYELFYEETVERLSRFGDRAEIMRMTSENAAPKFEEGELDFVYIDAQHHYEAVKKDIQLWWPKVRRGGILAGHDYLDGTREQGKYGVKSAVDQFVRTKGLTLRVSNEGDWESWFVFKR